MEHDLGKVGKTADGYTVKFERTFNHSIDKVWDAITNPEKLKYWFTDFEMELKVGSKIVIRFRDKDRTPSYGEVVLLDRPRRFVFTWEGEVADWQLYEEGKDACRLVFTYSKISDAYAINVPAGFHTLIVRLDEMLEGSQKIYPFGAEEDNVEHLTIKQKYEEIILSQYPELQRYQPIVVEQACNASPERVWQALTDVNQMRKWYFDISEFKAEPGFEFSFYGEGSKGEQYKHVCKVIEVVFGKKLSYSWQYEGLEGSSTVTFELRPVGKKTSVKLTHRGLHTFPHHPDFSRDSFGAGWSELIGKLLKDFVEKTT